MLGHVHGGTGRDLRLARRRRRPDLSTPRERDCAIRISDGKDLRQLLVSCTVPVGRRREDVEEPREFLYHSRPRASRLQAVLDSISALLGSLPPSAQLYVRRSSASGNFSRSSSQLPIAP